MERSLLSQIPTGEQECDCMTYFVNGYKFGE